MPEVRVTLDPAALAEFIRSPAGQVFRTFMEAGEVVKRGAQARVGVSDPDPLGRGGKPGRLRDSIVKRVLPHGSTFAVAVGSYTVPYALVHHEGSGPHPIEPRRAPQLVFFSAKAGRVIHTKHVDHPGTKPNRYLTDSLNDLRGTLL